MTEAQILLIAKCQPDFPASFVDWLEDNLPIYSRFEQEARAIAQSGREHYSAYTIREYIRHETALRESGTGFKIGNNNTPYLARLFALLNPKYAGLFDFRALKSA